MARMTHLGVAACTWLALASAPMASAAEPIVLTPAGLDAVTAGWSAAVATVLAGAKGESGALAATLTKTAATGRQRGGTATSQGAALTAAQGGGEVETSITTGGYVGNGSSGGASAVSQTSSFASGGTVIASTSSLTHVAVGGN